MCEDLEAERRENAVTARSSRARPWQSSFSGLLRFARNDEVLLMIFTLLFSSFSFAEDIEESMRMPKQMQGAEIVEKRGAKIDGNLVFTNHKGMSTPMKTIFNDEQTRPAVVILGYYGCPMLCGLVSKAFLETIPKMSLVLGEDYRVLSFSIDPKEKSDLSAAKRQSHLKALKLDDGDWEFYTGDEASIKTLADTLGFGYNYDASSEQYAHGAGVFILTPNGVLSNTLWGVAYDPWTTKAALMDASGGKIGNVLDKILMTCFHYVPDKHKYGFYVFGAMRLGAALTVLFLGSMLGWYWISERRRRIGVA